jgi:hypothetical protein
MVTNLDKKQIDLIKESLCVYEKARECKSLLRQERLFFANVEDFVDDRGKSCLFRLKEMCHDLFRNSTEASYKEKLFDITVGYTFHGAMKLRENLYLLEYYQPQCEMTLQNLNDQERKIVNEIGVLVRKAKARLKEELRKITAEFLKTLGYRVFTAKNGEEALALFRQKSISDGVWGSRRIS